MIDLILAIPGNKEEIVLNKYDGKKKNKLIN